jgi:D-sedoheptulose 7-phosphate isomerase/D-glycero-D-manno-heptose 1,7-bisphosphate phosphatase
MTSLRDPEVAARAGGVRSANFPSRRYPDASSYFDDYHDILDHAAFTIDRTAVGRAACLLLEAHARGSCIFSCGNGGSAAIANHLQCDHLKGVSTDTDLAPRVVSLASNVELITAVANDIAYDDVFAYQLRAQARAGDVLVAISSSGRSPNIIRALTTARDCRVATIALTGFGGGDAGRVADVHIHVDATNYGIIEDLHQAIMHALAQYIRQSRMAEAAIASKAF